MHPILFLKYGCDSHAHDGLGQHGCGGRSNRRRSRKLRSVATVQLSGSPLLRVLRAATQAMDSLDEMLTGHDPTASLDSPSKIMLGEEDDEVNMVM